jgi:Putative glycolipid-binding
VLLCRSERSKELELLVLRHELAFLRRQPRRARFRPVDAPAALCAPTCRVERLEQIYTRLPNDGERSRYDYAAPTFDFRTVLTYDPFGFVLDYPRIAVRVA